MTISETAENIARRLETLSLLEDTPMLVQNGKTKDIYTSNLSLKVIKNFGNIPITKLKRGMTKEQIEEIIDNFLATGQTKGIRSK